MNEMTLSGQVKEAVDAGMTVEDGAKLLSMSMDDFATISHLISVRATGGVRDSHKASAILRVIDADGGMCRDVAWLANEIGNGRRRETKGWRNLVRSQSCPNMRERLDAIANGDFIDDVKRQAVMFRRSIVDGRMPTNEFESAKKFVLSHHVNIPRVTKTNHDGSLVNAVAEAMKGHHHDQEAAAREAKTCKNTYHIVSKLIVIRDSPLVLEEHRSKAVEYLSDIEARRKITRETLAVSTELIRANRDKLKFRKRDGSSADRWKEKRTRQRIDRRRQKGFDAMMIYIREACDGIAEMTFPNISQEGRRKAVIILNDSIGSISRLMARLMGGTEETGHEQDVQEGK